MNISDEEIKLITKSLDVETPRWSETLPTLYTYPDSIMPYWRPFNKDNLDKAIKNRKAKKAKIYVHVPFCNTSCTYCPFKAYVIKGEEKHAKYIKYVKKEIDLTIKLMGEIEGEEIYFGGGTGSILSAKLLKDILFYVKEKFPISKDYTWTLEGSPETITEEKLQIAKEVGVDRISLGVQSLDDDVLKKVNRPHDTQQAIDAINLIKKFNFHMFNVDTMLCLPGQTLGSYEEDIRKLVKLKIPSICLHSLNTLPKTGLKNYKKDLSLHSQMVINACKIMLDDSYVQVRGNYFMRKDYVEAWKKDLCLVQHKPLGTIERIKVGFGISASTQIGNYNFIKTDNFEEYYSNLDKNELSIAKEFTYEKQDIISKFFMIQFIQLMKFNISSFEKEFGMPIPEIEQKKLDKLYKIGLAKKEGDVISLTTKGVIFQGMVERFFLPEKYKD